MKFILAIFLFYSLQGCSYCWAVQPIIQESVVEGKAIKKNDLIFKKIDALETKTNALFIVNFVSACFVIVLSAYIFGFKNDVSNSIKKDFEKLNDELFILIDDGHTLRNSFCKFMDGHGDEDVYQKVRDMLHKISHNELGKASTILGHLPSCFDLTNEENKNSLRDTLSFFIDNNAYFLELIKIEGGKEFYVKYLSVMIRLVVKLKELGA